MERAKHIDIGPGGYKRLGWFGAAFGVICLIGLTAAIALEDADALAEIALVLAIAAFVVQIGVSLLQAESSRAAVTESQWLNFETNKALEQIKASASANQEILARQFDALLQALIDRGGNGTKKSKGPPPALDSAEADSLASDIRRLSAPSPRVSDEDARILAELATWPDAVRGQRAQADLETLSPRAVAGIERLLRDEENSRENGRWVGLLLTLDDPVEGPADRELIERGLAEAFERGGHQQLRLTERGRDVARVLTVKGTPPDWYQGPVLDEPSPESERT